MRHVNFSWLRLVKARTPEKLFCFISMDNLLNKGLFWLFFLEEYTLIAGKL